MLNSTENTATTAADQTEPSSVTDTGLEAGVAGSAAAWAHGSVAVVVPVRAKPGRDAQALTGRTWMLQHLFPRGVALSNPNEVTWEPIADERIERALYPATAELWLQKTVTTAATGPASASATATATEPDPDTGDGDTDGDAGQSAGATATPIPTVETQAQSLAALLENAGWHDAEFEPGTPDSASKTRLPSGCAVRAIEVLSFAAVHGDGEDPDLFLVIHLALQGNALADPGQVVGFFGRIAGKSDERTGYPSKSLEARVSGVRRVMTNNQWGALLKALGLEPIGTGRGLLAWRPFVISHLVPAGEVPAGPFINNPASGESGWGDAEQWAWRMTGGQWLNQTWAPPRGAGEASRRTAWFGSTMVRAEESSLTFVATSPIAGVDTVHPREGAVWWRPESYNVEHVRCASLVHRQAVWLAALSIRQSEQLQRHSVALSNIEWPDLTPPAPTTPPPAPAGAAAPAAPGAAASAGVVGTPASTGAVPAPVSAAEQREAVRECEVAQLAEAQRSAQQVQALELRLLRVRNRLWFTLISGRPAETTMLQLLQDAARTPELLDDIAGEQEQVTRVLDQMSSRMQTERDNRTSRFLGNLSAIIGLVFILDVAFGVAQVWTGGSLLAATITLGVAVPIAIGAFFWLRRRLSQLEPTRTQQSRSVEPSPAVKSLVQRFRVTRA